MSFDAHKRLRMFAGPNGSGKTCLVRKLAKELSADGLFQLRYFLNADDIFRNLHDGTGIDLEFLGKTIEVEQIRTALQSGGRLPSDHSFLETMRIPNGRLMDTARDSDAYVAASLVDFLREELLAAGRSFSFETVRAHRSKIDFLARAAGIGLTFISLPRNPLASARIVSKRASPWVDTMYPRARSQNDMNAVSNLSVKLSPMLTERFYSITPARSRFGSLS
jgi:predicted ABC-type ATPase